ncbi:histidine kinase [Desulfuromusa kysingii]|uniref:histidine kinase n=1 Tax=Desulfuromusa kysingii TaxID=37625 RepID=A0A1H4E6S0_9BACT|nr:ATP-binding protein [Desulfuromusa kysingii]SEA80042.1 histidine kinase [Desulfuromusa kysingii]
MKRYLLWKLLLNIVPVIIVTILVVWLAIDNLAATYFMNLMENYAIEPHDSNRMFIEAVHRYLLWAALVAMVLALLLSYLMTKRVLRPLLQMTQISKELASGHFANRVEVVSRDEVGQLGSAFNQMANSLEQLEQLRKNMVTDVAHELRTPLTNLRGYLEALSDAVVPPSIETFRMLENEILRLVNLVDDLQQLSKAESAQAFLKRQKLQVDILMTQLLSLFELRLKGQQIAVQVNLEPRDIRIAADPDKLLQALRNLVENALRYAPKAGTIIIAAHRIQDMVEISISNTGTGIAAADLPYIFERFFRVDRSRSRDHGGAGIGLAIVKQLVEAHGGKVGAESKNGLTKIWLQLPA